MAFSSGSTLQQTDEVAAVASSSSGAAAGGGGVTADAIASALNHSPGLDGGIQTTIRASGSATDAALVTEQAVREALGTVQVDLGDDGTADIAPLKQISVVGDTSGIFSVGDESGELAVDVSDVAILTENETFTNGLNVTGGNVGIGTTSPVEKLEVNGSIFADGEQQIIGIDASDQVRLGFIKQFGFGPKIGAEKGSDITLGHLDTTNLRSFTSSTNWNPRLTIGTNGNVGIGTTSPSYALEVSGDARAQGTLRGTQLRDDSGYVEGLFGEGFVLKDQRNSNGRSYMELDDMRVRGELRAHIFKKDIVRATNALLYVSDAAQTTEDVTTPSSTGSTFTLFVDTSVFQAGEEITFKDSSGGGITEVVGTVSNVVGSTTRGGQTVYELSVTLDFGTSATIPGGSTVVRTSGARMLLDASTADAPVQTLWDDNGNRRMAEGNLDGQFGITSETYGMAAGTEGGAHIKATENGVRIYDSTNTAFFKVDPSLDPEVQLDGDALVDGTVTSDKINVNEVLTLKPGAAFFAGQGQTRFAFGDFSLDRQVKGEVSYSIGALASGNDSEESNLGIRSEDYSSGQWLASHRANYSISTSGSAQAQALVHIEAKDSQNNTLASNFSTVSASSQTGGGDSGQGVVEVSLAIPSNTSEIQFYVSCETQVADVQSSASASAGIDAQGAEDTVTNVVTSTDFFGPDGATWRSGGNVQVEINGRGNTSSQTTGAGQIWVLDKVIENSDLRNKSGVQGIEGGLDVMRDLRGITYDRGAGIAAQDLLNTFEPALFGNREDGYSVAYTALWGPAIKAFQELDATTKDHEDRISALEDKV